MSSTDAEDISFEGFLWEVENSITQAIGNDPTEWDENFISRSIVKNFKENLKKIYIFSNTSKRLEWYPYKLKGKSENNFGDIAILVNIHYGEGKSLTGLGYLEAKIRYKKNPCHYDGMNKDQLKRINNNAPHSFLLLYDYEIIKRFAYNREFEFYPFYCPFKGTKAVVIPTNIVLSQFYKDLTLYSFSLPFSYQLCQRFLNGLDLDLKEENFKLIKGNISNDYGNKRGDQLDLPLYLMVFSIGKKNYEPVSIEDLPVDREFYSSF